MPFKYTKFIILQLLKGLAHMHSRNIVHRDLKPQNILMKEKGSFALVIADFGLATCIQDEEYIHTRCGTPGYISPEIMQAQPNQKLLNTSSDIFSLGAIFYHLLTSFYLFEASNANEVQAKNAAFEFSLEQL